VWIDHWVVACLVPVAVWILLNGLEDLLIDLVFFCRRREFPWPPEAELTQAAQRRIAILVPLWQEHAVIGPMLRHNLSVVRYGNYDVFVGVYPNDPLSIAAVNQMAREDARVHVTVCPHDGPTSKGDCLNWAYRGMIAYEARRGIDFEIIITHDAEDLIHPESLRLTNWFSRDHEMVQIPVLPLPTKPGEWTHGLYCDEFAEYQFKDIPVRQQLGGFLPANGVGTGFERSALERLRRHHNGDVFDADSLTEDYESGFLMHAAGYRQIFVPLRGGGREPVATREYFPRGWREAIRQRSRWVSGVAL
jgi:adsorption protein B